jgi:hypothetical protein
VATVAATSAAGVGAQRICDAPLDVSGSGIAEAELRGDMDQQPLPADLDLASLPNWLAAIKHVDGLAFPAHALLGGGLERAGCDPSATALQWLKAAAHADGPERITTAGDGLKAALGRSTDSPQLAERLCRLMDLPPGDAAGDRMLRREHAAAVQVGLGCTWIRSQNLDQAP